MLMFIFSLALTFANSTVLPSGHIPYYGSDFYQSNHKDLKNKLYTILSSGHKVQAKDYDQIGCEGDGQGMFVKDVYCHKKIYFQSVGQIRNMGNIINIEHTWPQSKFSSSFDKNLQKSDL